MMGSIISSTRRKSTVATFTPASISNLLAWYDASDGATITHVGGSVSQWNDKSGNAYHATQGTGASQPVTGTRTVNSRNVLDFDGSNDFMTLPSGARAFSSGSSTTVIVFASDDTSTRCALICGQVSSSNRYFVIHTPATPLTEGSHGTSGPVTFTTPTTPNTSAHIIGVWRDLTSIAPFYDGVQPSAGSNASSLVLSNLTLGAASNGGALFLNGVLCEVILYTRKLSNAEFNTLGAHLASKWGATWTGF